MVNGTTTSIGGFNPRSRAGSDAIISTIVSTGERFNPRSRAGSDPGILGAHAHLIVSIHAPARGATRIEPTNSIANKFQSTLPRGERRELVK